MRAGVASAGVDDASNSSAPMKSLYEQPEKPFEDVKGCMFTSKALRLPFTLLCGLVYLPLYRVPSSDEIAQRRDCASSLRNPQGRSRKHWRIRRACRGRHNEQRLSLSGQAIFPGEAGLTDKSRTWGLRVKCRLGRHANFIIQSTSMERAPVLSNTGSQRVAPEVLPQAPPRKTD